MVPGAGGEHMAQTVRFREILRRLAIVDEGFAGDQAGLGWAGCAEADVAHVPSRPR